MLRHVIRIGCLGVALLLPNILCSATCADLILLTADRIEWESAVGAFTTVDFAGFPLGTEIGDQYADLGVRFPSTEDYIFDCGSCSDGGGILSTNEVFLTFDTPQLGFATDFIASIKYQFFLDGRLVSESPNLGSGPAFVGVLSDTAFDSVLLTGVAGGPVVLDNLYFATVPSPPALWAVAGVWLLHRRRRR